MKKMKMFLLILSLSGFGFINAQNAQPEFSDIMTRAYTSLQDADKSEVSTLAGFALNAQVAADPENNGPALFGELIGAYKAAIAIDPSNPRPVYLLARFNRVMAKFMGQTSPEFCKELLKAKELYEARKDKPFYPSWGKEEVTRLLLECDKQ